MTDPLTWSDDDIDRLSEYDQRDVDEALAWWASVVPGALALLLPRPDGEQRYTYDMTTGRYTDTRTGQELTEVEVRHALDIALDAASVEARGMADQLRDGAVALAAWQLAMALLVKRTHYVSSALSVGGVMMQPALAPVVGTRDALREQLTFLRRFADQIATGAQRLDGDVSRRAHLYGQAARQHYEGARVEVKHVLLRHDEARNVLGVADHCEECVGESERKWVPVGEMSIPGSRTCDKNCRCVLETRRAA